ncbi:hypothetical protein QYE76_022290 [Lolium multiflorum]|uniref:TF-B3 domain-containing protein n=1 Tax=Lolium multiflorum TaxID=4521 RepID=A0AAD8VU07_LOLMU|nr:hypothetical protein QYE76_022290 [Lolium multiflorum]
MWLREASCNFYRWTVEILFGGQGKMYLHTRWGKFARDLALEPGCQLTFLYEGDGEMIVKVFDATACRRHYHTGRDLALEPGCQLTFLYEGDGKMIVKVFDATACRRHYHTGESCSNTDS